MSRVLVPVRYPLSEHSQRTLSEAIRVAEERSADLTILHVNLYHRGNETNRTDLKRTVEQAFGGLANARYVVRDGFLIEETILEEVAATRADVVVIGRKQMGRWRRAIRRLVDDPNIENFLREKIDCELITVG
ncbi:Universal stress protein family protein [Haladaptatus litoreus]|uniref:Universal stress protein family protein n=1 Tax=Haladaptatus litoreus TaxID=553468 RepID=A0A1N6Z1C9_9EURY|nr:universal stress protein [Haladaptatus litoreus]SIR20658.1 Universal stress protein family protein [Haladaptatus litoreus]